MLNYTNAAPSWKPDATPTSKGWVDTHTGELIVATKNITSVTKSSNITNGSPNVTVGSTVGLEAGMPASGTGIAAGTKILSITNGTTLVLDKNATATNATASVKYGPDVQATSAAYEVAQTPQMRTSFGVGDNPAYLD